MAKFQKGQSGNPKGRPKGTGKIDAYRKMLDPAMPEILTKLVDLAKGGDLAAIRIIMERLYPAQQETVTAMLDRIDEIEEQMNRQQRLSAVRSI